MTAVPYPARGLKARQQRRWRARRMQAFLAKIRPAPHARVLDLGGTDELWDLIDWPLEVTLLNTEDGLARHGSRSARPRVAGDACDLSRFPDRAFDVVFSNGVIEHVGAPARVAAFAAEARRVGRAYWIQTPCWLFPIEAHTGLPWFWLYPRPLRARIARYLDRPAARARRPDPIGSTTFLTLGALRRLFPDAAVYTERVAGLPKSWSLYRADAGRAPAGTEVRDAGR